MSDIFTRDADGAKFKLDPKYVGLESEVLKPIPEQPKRWRGEQYGEYYYLIEDLEVSRGIESNPPSMKYIDDERFDLGNYFRTEQQAQAGADAIKKLLEYLHTPLKESETQADHLKDYRTAMDLIAMVDTARKAVQSEDGNE